MSILAEWAAHTMEALPKNTRARLVDGELVVTPVTGALGTTARRIFDQIERQAPGWHSIGRFQVLPTRSGYAPEPEASAVREDIYDPAVTGYDQSVLPFVAEIVSPQARLRSCAERSVEYADRGIPVFLAVDVRNASWAVMSKPVGTGDGSEYRRVENGRFGEPIEIVAGDFAVTLDSSEFQSMGVRPTA